jgi:hypothetical protein
LDRDSLEKMLLQAKTEISQIERQMVTLTTRRDLLWRFVENSRDLIAVESGEEAPKRELVPASSAVDASPILKSTLTPNTSSVLVQTSRIWEAVAIVMKIARRPLTVPEIIELLEKNKIIVGGEFPQENIRSAVARKEDVFEKIGRGLYALKEWPDSVKQMRKDETLFDVA